MFGQYSLLNTAFRLAEFTAKVRKMNIKIIKLYKQVRGKQEFCITAQKIAPGSRDLTFKTKTKNIKKNKNHIIGVKQF